MNFTTYIYNYYYFLTKKLDRMVVSLQTGSLNKKDLHDYIIHSKILQKLELFIPETSEPQQFDVDTYINIQTELNKYLDINLHYYEFTYS